MTPPTTWSAPDWADHAADSLELRTRLDALTGADNMRGAEQGTVAIDAVDDLELLFDAGAPSLSDTVSAGFGPIVDDAFVEFVEVIQAGAVDVIGDPVAWNPGPHGGIAGTDQRGVNEGGLEVRQVVDKGLFGGAGLYRHALTLSAGVLDEAALDGIAAAWGANADLDAAGALTDSANYSNAMGLHAEIATALIAAKAYAADDACGAERDAAVRTVFRAWERTLVFRYVYYANLAKGLIDGAADDTTGDDARIDGLHELSEGLGLVLGLHGLVDPEGGPLTEGARVLTDPQIEAIMTAMGVDLDDLGASTTGAFVLGGSDYADAVAAAEAVIADAFDLDAADLAAIRAPTPG